MAADDLREAVSALHRPEARGPNAAELVDYCRHCRVPWPCMTGRLLDAHPVPSEPGATVVEEPTALAAIRDAFWECFDPDFNGVDWRDDAAIQTFARKVAPYVNRRADQ